jgi:hypothetical protein
MKEPDEAVARSGPDQRTSQGASGSVARVTDDGTKRRQVHKVPSTEVGQAPHRAHRAGWSIGKLGSGHLRWTSPTREAVVDVVHSERLVSRALRQLREAGLA